MNNKYNKSPISMKEGIVCIDGIEVSDCVNCTITFTPDVWSGKVLGERTPSSRWTGYTITGTITRRRSTNWLREIVSKYKSSGITPEFTIQGIMNDAGSDFVRENGSDTVTAVGCVLTGNINLTALDTNGDVVDDSITFNAKDIII